MRFRILLFFSIFFLAFSIIVLANPDYFFRYPSAYDDTSTQCDDGTEANAYAYDNVNATCQDVGAAAAYTYWWNDTPQTSMGTISQVQFGVKYAFTVGGVNSDLWALEYSVANTPLACSDAGRNNWITIASGGITQTDWVFANVTNTSVMNWTAVNNTCWRLMIDRVGNSDSWSINIDAYHANLTYAPTKCEGSNPYTQGSGSWTITGETTCNNEDFGVNGNITINSGATLNLIGNTKLRLASASNNSFIINKGTLLVNYSNITTNATNVFFSVNSSGTLDVNNSFIGRAGWNNVLVGINATNNINIKNTTINDTFTAIAIFTTSNYPNVTNTTMTNVGYYGVRFNGGVVNANISGNNISSYDDSIYTENGWLNSSNISFNILKSSSHSTIDIVALGHNRINVLNNVVYANINGIVLNNNAPSIELNTTDNVSSNIIYTTGSTGYGIYLVRIGEAEVRNNTVVNATYSALLIYDTSGLQTINNTFNSTSTTFPAVAIWPSSPAPTTNNTLTNNSIKSTGNTGIMITRGSHRFIGNRIETTASGMDGINISTSETNTSYFESNNITGTLYGVRLISSNNNYFNMTNITATASTGNSIQNSGSNNTFKEGYLTRGSSGKYLGMTAGLVDFINVTNFSEKSQVTITGGTLRNYWYADIYVNDTVGTALENANVTIFNTTENFAIWNLTNSTGYTNQHIIKEYNQTSAGVINSSNYSLNTTLAGYNDNFTWSVITQQKLVVITLTQPSVDNSFNIAFPSPYSGSYNSSANNATLGTWISFNFTKLYENWREPFTNGSSSDNQAGPSKPIFLIYNTGNANLELKINNSVVSGISTCANSTCVASECSGNPTACTVIDGSSLISMGIVNTGKRLNVTLYANLTYATQGESSGEIYVQSS